MSLSRLCTLLCGLSLISCTAPEPAATKPEGPAPPTRPAPEVVPPTVAVKAETPAERPSEPPPATELAPPVVTAETKIGVAACDAYADRYRTCIADNAAESDKERHTRALNAQLAAWLAAKADPKLAPALDAECAAAAEAARATTRILGCVCRDGDSPDPEKPRPGKLKPEVIQTRQSRQLDPFE